MSRTNRTIRYTDIEIKDMCEYNDVESEGRFRAHIMNKWRQSLPKHFRKSVTKTRRAVDKRVLYREINDVFHREAYSKWNCKDDNAWSYW